MSTGISVTEGADILKGMLDAGLTRVEARMLADARFKMAVSQFEAKPNGEMYRDLIRCALFLQATRNPEK